MRFVDCVGTCVLAVCLASGCGGRREVYDRPLESAGPFAVRGGLCFVNVTLGALVRLGVAGDGVRVDRAWVPPSPRMVTEVQGGRRLAVLHDDPDAPGVGLLEASSLRPDVFLPLGERFDRLQVSPSGRYGVAHFSPAAGAGGAIRNLNQIQLLDFESDTSHPPHALETGGLAPRGVRFVPAGSGAYDDVIVVLVDNGLVFLDPAEPAGEPLWARFTNAPGGLAVPAEVVFGPFGAGGGYVYVRLQGADDVLSVHLVREAGRLARTINFLNVPASSRPSDLLVLRGAGLEDKVLVVYGAGQAAALLDANAIQTGERLFTFGSPVSLARRLTIEDPRRELAAVYQPQGASSRVYLIDPLGGAVEQVHLQDAFTSLEGPKDEALLVAFHPRLARSDTPGLRVIRTGFDQTTGRLDHRVATYSLDTPLAVHAFRGQDATMVAALDDSRDAFVLDLDTGGYAAMQVGRAPTRAGWVPGTDWTWVQHPHPLGSITLARADRFNPRHAVVLEGFILDGLLDPR